jgi:hypothetical protein
MVTPREVQSIFREAGAFSDGQQCASGVPLAKPGTTPAPVSR